MNTNAKKLCYAALIAALYTALSLLFLPISFGPIQCRISEMLTILPAFLSAGVMGVTIGCLLTNILGGAILPDIIFGTLATFIGAVLTRVLTRALMKELRARLKTENTVQPGLRLRLLTVLPPIISNTIIVPMVLKYAYGFEDALYFMIVTVCIGEIIGIGIIGNLLMTLLCKKNIFRHLDEIGALD